MKLLCKNSCVFENKNFHFHLFFTCSGSRRIPAKFPTNLFVGIDRPDSKGRHSIVTGPIAVRPLAPSVLLPHAEGGLKGAPSLTGGLGRQLGRIRELALLGRVTAWGRGGGGRRGGKVVCPSFILLKVRRSIKS